MLMPGRQAGAFEGGAELVFSTEQVITDRQVEVLGLAAEGLAAPEIAERLVVYPRLGVRDRASAVAEAMRLGLIE
jgi:DNA-binding NarL/FixJ family response regulator